MLQGKELPMATLQAATTKGTVTQKQSVEYLPTQYIPELGVVRVESNNWFSKQYDCASDQQTSKHQATMRNTMPNSRSPPKQSKGQPLICIVSNFTSPKFHLATFKLKKMQSLKCCQQCCDVCKSRWWCTCEMNSATCDLVTPPRLPLAYSSASVSWASQWLSLAQSRSSLSLCSRE